MGNWPNDFIAAFSAHDLDAVLSCFTDDIFYEEVVADGVVAHGKQELRARIRGIFAAFPDIKLELICHFSSGGQHCLEWISSGTTAASQGSPGTVKWFSYREAVIAEMKGGKITRFSLYCDMMTFMRQLGVLPAATAADFFIGTWKLNMPKSKSTEMPKSETMKYVAIETGLQGIIDGIDTEGEAFHLEFLITLDGKYYPIKGFPYLDMDSSQRIDASTILHVAMKAGREVESWRIAVSEDGKTLTLTGKGITHKGQAFSGTRFFDRL